MNLMEKAIQKINPPVSPIPDDMKTKFIQSALGKLQGVPKDVTKSLQSAVNISPLMDLAKRINIQSSYLPYGGTPYEEQKKFTTQNIKDALQASHLIGYATPLRMFTRNPLKLVSGQSARRLSSGKGWELFDRILNKKIKNVF